MVLLPSGAILAGVGSTEFAVLRATAQGQLDPTYGSGGVASLTLPTALTSNGGIVASPDGTAVGVGSTGTAIDLARFLPDGGLDTSFGDAGLASTPSPFSAVGIARMLDGGFAIALVSSGSSVGVVRFQSDGSLDPSFGSGGFQMIPTDASYGMSITVDTTGRILIAIGAAGPTKSSLLFVRFLP